DCPRREAADDCHADQRSRLQEHAGNDGSLPSQPVTHRTGHELTDSPRRRVNRGERTHGPQRKTRGREQQWKYTPREAVVQIVDETSLADTEHVRVRPDRARKDCPKTGTIGEDTFLVPSCLEADVV